MFSRSEHEVNGMLPAYAWPGGYPLVYIASDGEILCAGDECANGREARDAAADDGNMGRDSGWLLVGVDIHWEGPDEICAHCGALIPSAYGEPDQD